MKNNRLVAFIYAALQTLPKTQVEALIAQAENSPAEFDRADYSDPRQAMTARDLANRLTKRGATEKQRKHLEKARPK